MKDNKLDKETATAIFIDRVHHSSAKDFEAWLKKIHADSKEADGFLEVSTVKTDSDDSVEYVTLLTFKNKERLNTWTSSDQSKKWLKMLPRFLENQSKAQTDHIGFWPEKPSKDSPFWKQVTLGIITVYPSVMALNFLLSPLLIKLPNALSILLVVTLLSALLTWPIMPLANSLLKHWLYK